MYAEFRLLSSLEKLFIDEQPHTPAPVVEGFQNEALSFQAAFILRESEAPQFVKVEVDSPLAEHITLREVRHVPVTLPCYADTDDNYLRKTPGLYPDLLSEVKPHSLRPRPDQWRCLWITVEPDGQVPAGDYPITLRLATEDGTALGEITQQVTLLPGMLPPQTLIHTKWFYTDCLADYYHVEVFSEEHWRIIENFMRSAVEGGINMILMPVHTPPLDTRVGGERTTTQLVDITVENGEYTFEMSKVRRWIDLCKKVGVEYYEIAHLFTQWGAGHAPKIVAKVDGVEQRIFGWDTDAAGEEYGAFLRQYVPALRKVFEEEGIADKCSWHISDEPTEEQLESYLASQKQVEEVLQGAHVMDALSSIKFYEQGIIKHPVPSINHIQPFLDAKVPELWTYYCCGQHKDVTNLFLAMPSTRTRVLGAQLFRYKLVGFLQWGYNFYNTVWSDYPVDPYLVTDGNCWVPAGDTFQVYPGPGGQPELSIRWMVIREAMQDLRALQMLEQKIGFEKTNALLGDMTLTQYTRDAEEWLALRRRINAMIVEG